jgi:hypothetical protein
VVKAHGGTSHPGQSANAAPPLASPHFPCIAAVERLGSRIARAWADEGDDMAKGMNKRKEVKKPKKEAAKPAVSVASSNAKVTINPGKAKD